jgi:antitoxin component YwqK of YwqJK toxin-antitoxin module
VSRAGRTLRTFLVALVPAVGPGGCGEEERVPLDSLVLRDSLYLDAGTGAPFTGFVARRFEDGALQLEGRLEDGTWNGELTVWHPGGSVRYQGRLVDGAQCGAWVENRDEGEETSVYEELKREIESMGLYPPCPER